MRFEQFGIDQGILKSIQKRGYKKPTDIQFKAIPHILAGEDILAIAQTGTGKTAAFALPVLQMLQNRKKSRRPDGVKCVVMEPTHELAMQTAESFKLLGKHTPVKTLCIHGGVDQAPQIAGLNRGVDVLVATPGRMFDLVSQGHLRMNRVEILVLDEADHMLDLGFIKDIRDLIKHLPQRRQTLFFSATIDTKIKNLAYSLVNNPIRIQISPKDPVSRNVSHALSFIEMDDKRYFLERIIKQDIEQKILVFVRTKVRAERVSKALERVDIRSTTIHGDKGQEDRTRALDDFRHDRIKVLVATDVSARGIDIPYVDIVVNYDLPEQEENYVHRVGRTGRGTEKGQAITFCSKEEKPMLEKIETYLGKKIDVLHLDKSEYKETIEAYGDLKDPNDWQNVITDIESVEERKNKKKKKGKS